MHLLFYHIYCWVQRHKTMSVVFAVLFLLLFGFLASKIRFEEDITQIIPKSEKSDLTTRAIRQVNFADKITVLLQKDPQGSVDDLIALANSLSDTLQRDTLYLKEISGQVDQESIAEVYDFVYQNIPLFLEPADYDTLAYKMDRNAIVKKMAANLEVLSTPTGFVAADFIQKDPLGLGLIGLQKLQKLGVGDNFTLIDGFIGSKDSTQLLLFLTPKYAGTETEKNKALAQELYSIQERLNAEFLGKAKLSYFGSALVAVANADQIKADILKTVCISMSVLMVLLILFYRKIYIPILVFVPTIFAAVFALGCLYLYKPLISAISLSIGAVLIGITIDYTLHILTHFKKNSDVKLLYKELTKPLLMSGTTNAVAFLCLLFVHSTALIDLGIFASITLVASAVFTLLIIPHLYTAKEELKHHTWLDKIAAFSFERSRLLIWTCVVLIVIGVFTSNRVTFNNDLSGLNYMPEDLKHTEQELDKLTNTSAKSLYIVATGNTLDTALQRNEEVADWLAIVKDKNLIVSFSSIGDLLNPWQLQQAKIAQWNSFWHFHNPQQLIRNIQYAGEKYGFTADAHDEFYDLLNKSFQPIGLHDLQKLPNSGVYDFVVQRNNFYTVSSFVKLEEKHRQTIVQVFEKIPGVVVVDRKQLNETYLGKLRDDFNALLGYSSVAILLILWLFFSRIELVLLAAIPIGLTGLVTAGLMAVFGLEFNIFSAIVCTLVFGHGVDFSIFMTAALQRQYTTGEDELQVYRTSILLAVLTTVLAIGALVFAKHPALISISSVSLIGVFAAVIITFVFYPLIFRFFITDRAAKGKSPFTVFILFWSILLFFYYGVGCLLLSAIARFIFPLLPLSKDRKDRVIRFIVAKFMRSVLYGYPLVKNKTLNPFGETFEKPAIIIANHSSFLDTLSMGMLVPKMIFLVNDWVWKSPIFGRAIQSLGFYPVSAGVEESIAFLQEKVKSGYSIVVFPEGTRSQDNALKRFHKGAFYLAAQLQLDVVPIFLHGNGDVLPKGDVIIYPGKLTAVIGKRIAMEDSSFGSSYSVRCKNIAASFKAEFQDWRLQLEDEQYFIKKLQLAYLFKDEEVCAEVYQNLERWKALFYRLNTYIPADATLMHWSDTHGELDYLLSLQQGKRKIMGFIENVDARMVAQSIYWQQHRDVRFYDGLKAADMLLLSKHLMQSELDNLPLDMFTIIMNINSKNNLAFLTDKGYRLIVNDGGISIFEK
ncbi:1-acyl-sn-glycerol-3-phosphate acyltransferase [Sphingobacterium sp. Mn56C]|uniref:1-acyl-sn-glycerol-3-phosphate acyltransferase n=1 Tax=Sphingobacterium sp. Mn56C TaxID=3395261 RepID=UPI003BF54041